MAYNKFYGQLYDAANRIFDEYYKNRPDMGREPSKWILSALRKYSALDVLGEFMDKVGKPRRTVKNRQYIAGYYDALADLTRYIQREMDKENE